MRHESGRTAADRARRRAADLFDAHFDAVYRYCLARTADPVLAEEAAAQTFYEAARRLVADPATPVGRPWLFVAARRRLMDEWRRQDRQRRLRQRIELHSVGCEAEAPVDSDRVVQALASLPERQRRAVVLRYLEERSVAEVADELDLGYQAAESLLARGRRGFERAWEEQT